MKKLLTKIALALTAVLLAASLTACDALPNSIKGELKDAVDSLTCEHKDENDDGYCDKCRFVFSDGSDFCQHRDKNDDTRCDSCGKGYVDGKDKVDSDLCQHRDENDDSLCDKCYTEYTDGTDVHVHRYGEWIKLPGQDNTPCNELMFYRNCYGCENVQQRRGNYLDHDISTVTVSPTCVARGYDENTCSLCGFTEQTNYTDRVSHEYESSYSYDSTHHWLDCKSCDAMSSYLEHTVDASGYCTVCDQPLTPTEGVIYDYDKDVSYAEVIGYEGASSRVVIASEYGGLPVKGIYKEAFKDSAITSVIIPEGVSSIGEGAFKYCYKLSSISIPSSITSIGESAFHFCESLKAISLPAGVKEIKAYAFASCYALKDITIPESVWLIDEYAFNSCRAISELTLPSNITYIGNNAFTGCSSLSFTEYERGKYLGSKDNPHACLIELTNKNYSTYTINESTRVIGYGAFKDCERLGTISIPESVVAINGYAFSGCTSLASVAIPKNVTEIGFGAFSGCSSLASATFALTDGWWYSSSLDGEPKGDISEQSLSSTDTAAKCLTSTYDYNYWHKRAEE